MLKIISDSKCIEEIRHGIEVARTNIKRGLDPNDQFDIVYNHMRFAHKSGILNQKTLDILWKELQEATSI